LNQPTFNIERMPKMRVIIWNFAGGSPGKFGGQHEEAWRYLLSLKPDIALLQEAIIPKWVTTEWNVVWAPAYAKKKWGSAVVTHLPIIKQFDVVALEPELSELLEKFGGQVVGANIQSGIGQELIAISVHAPARKVQLNQIPASMLAAIKLRRNPYIWRADVIFGALRFLPKLGLPFVFGGDWNTSRLFDERYGPRDNNEFFDRMADAGFIDCLRRFHNTEVRTWFRPGDAHYQLDHLFCDDAFAKRLTSCLVHSEPAESMGYSDHAPIIADFDITAA
jgi:exonuclease III